MNVVAMFAQYRRRHPGWGAFRAVLGKENYDGFLRPDLLEHSTEELELIMIFNVLSPEGRKGLAMQIDREIRALSEPTV